MFMTHTQTYLSHLNFSLLFLRDVLVNISSLLCSLRQYTLLMQDQGTQEVKMVNKQFWKDSNGFFSSSDFTSLKLMVFFRLFDTFATSLEFKIL